MTTQQFITTVLIPFKEGKNPPINYRMHKPLSILLTDIGIDATITFFDDIGNHEIVVTEPSQTSPD